MLEQDPKTGRIVYDGNITMADAMAIEPMLVYARCTNAANQPQGFRGEWPVEGTVYPVRILKEFNGQEPYRLAVLGFEGAFPYYNVFALARFEVLTVIFPN